MDCYYGTFVMHAQEFHHVGVLIEDEFSFRTSLFGGEMLHQWEIDGKTNHHPERRKRSSMKSGIGT